jgi:hypothetical protein
MPATAVRKTMKPTSESNADIGKNITLKTSNKIDSYREVGVPEAVSHLLHLPDHVTGAASVNIHIPCLLQHMHHIHDVLVPDLNQMNKSTEQNHIDIVVGHIGFTHSYFR